MCDHIDKDGETQLWLDYDSNGIMIRHCMECDEHEVKIGQWVSKDAIATAFGEVCGIEYP